MNIRLTGRTALMLAAGLWIGVAGHVTPGFAQDAEPAAAATEAPAGKPIALKKFTRHQAAKKKVASSSRADKVKAEKAKATDSDDAAPVAADAGKATLPASIANANAQQLSTEPAADPFAATTPEQANPLQADALLKSVSADSHPESALVAEPGAQVVSPDELNELDRAAAEPRPALTLASATLDAPTAAPAPAAGEATTTDNSTWDKTSLIGKIFIAFGGLLTMASAARMFIA